MGIALSLGLDRAYFTDRYTRDPLTLFRLFNYPSANDPSSPADVPGQGTERPDDPGQQDHYNPGQKELIHKPPRLVPSLLLIGTGENPA